MAPRFQESDENHRGFKKYSDEQGIAEQEAIERGMNEKSKAFVEKGAEVYAKA